LSALATQVSTQAWLPAGPPFLLQNGGIGAQVAFRGFRFDRIPHGPVRPLRQEFDAHLAADAFRLINSPDIAVASST